MLLNTSFKKLALSVSFISMAGSSLAAQSYTDFPVTVKGYEGDKTSSVAYTGQAARQVLHNSLKNMVSKTNFDNQAQSLTNMALYASSKDDGRTILSPVSKDEFAVKQSNLDQLSKGKNLSSKTYGGAIAGFPGYMTGPEVLEFMIAKAAMTDNGYDPVNGLDYTQLISKFTMGAVFYNQAIDGYLDEKIHNAEKSNDKAYKDGAAYSAKEHYWDEAFGYFGAPAHTLSLTAKDVYNIAKQKPEGFAKADANKDGVVDLKTEMAYAHAYYAAGFDKGGKTNYLHTIVQAFVDGRQVIADANGEKLSADAMAKLDTQIEIISTNWEKVIAEAVFKYAGSVYKDLDVLNQAVEKDEGVAEAYRTYAKHWGELKGFALALQAGGADLGATAVKLNRLTGFSPVLLGNTQIIGVDADGEYLQAPSSDFNGFALHMLKVQQLMVDSFGIEARSNDALKGMDALIEKLGNKVSAEND